MPHSTEPAPAPRRTARDPAHVRLSELYAAHAARLHAYARRHTDPAGVEDLVADAFEIALRRLDDVPADPDDARAWLIGTVRRLAANRRRRERTREEHWHAAVRDGWHVVPGASPEDVVAERDACLAALGALSDTDREALLLVAWEGLSADRAGAVLGLTTNAFTVRLHRARRRLGGQLDGQFDTATPTPRLRSLT